MHNQPGINKAVPASAAMSAEHPSSWRSSVRREELLSVTVRSIDLQRREIHLDKTKTNAPRRVPLMDAAVVTVESLLNAPNRP
jgi:integrase